MTLSIAGRHRRPLTNREVARHRNVIIAVLVRRCGLSPEDVSLLLSKRITARQVRRVITTHTGPKFADLLDKRPAEVFPERTDPSTTPRRRKKRRRPRPIASSPAGDSLPEVVAPTIPAKPEFLDCSYSGDLFDG